MLFYERANEYPAYSWTHSWLSIPWKLSSSLIVIGALYHTQNTACRNSNAVLPTMRTLSMGVSTHSRISGRGGFVGRIRLIVGLGEREPEQRRGGLFGVACAVFDNTCEMSMCVVTVSHKQISKYLNCTLPSPVKYRIAHGLAL